MSTITSTGEPSAWLLSSQIDELFLCHCALPTSGGGRGSAQAGGRGLGKGPGAGAGAGAEKGQIDAGLSVVSSRALSHFGLHSPVLTFIRGFPSPAPPLLPLPPWRMLRDTMVCDA